MPPQAQKSGGAGSRANLIDGRSETANLQHMRDGLKYGVLLAAGWFVGGFLIAWGLGVLKDGLFAFILLAGYLGAWMLFFLVRRAFRRLRRK
jgi:hypothetical protein